MSRHTVTPARFVPDDEVINAVEELVDTVTEFTYHRYTDGTEEASRICRVCDEVDGHAADCFMPAVIAWREG